jgi:hypothetical protein
VWLIHTALARKLRQDLGKSVAEARGTLGISSKTCEESGKERLTATKAPVAETLRAVANSSNSFPLLSRVRTKTGIANGRRAQSRRSSCGRFRFKWGSSRGKIRVFYRIWGAKYATYFILAPGERRLSGGVCPEISL